MYVHSLGVHDDGVCAGTVASAATYFFLTAERGPSFALLETKNKTRRLVEKTDSCCPSRGIMWWD